MGYIGQNSTSIYMSWFDGSTWSGNSPVTLSSGDPQSTQTPWMAQLGDDLVMLSIGKASSKVYCSTMSGTTWSGNQPLKDISPIAPETDSSGAMMPYGVGIVTTYIGEHSAIIYQAKLQIFGQPVTG
jgi:hypothetical protein